MRQLLLIISILILAASVSADEKEFNFSKVRNKRNKTPMDVLVLEMQMGESGYQVSQSLDNKARLLATYEKAINEFCFGSLVTTYKYTFDASNIKCADQITKTLALDSTNPAAICAQAGMDSSACDLAYAGQKMGLADTMNSLENMARVRNSNSSSAAAKLVPSEVSEALDLQERLQSEKQDFADESFRAKVKSIQESYKSSKSQENKEKLEKALADWISEVCQGAEVRYVKNGQGLNRMRLLPSACLDAVTQGRSFDKNFVAAICNQEGFYTPNCTKARRLRAAMVKAKATPTPPPAGLATF